MKLPTFRLLICSIVILLASCNSNVSNKNITKDAIKDTSMVFDNEADFTKEQIIAFDKLYMDHEKKTTNQIALVTTADYGSDSTIDNYATSFGKKYRVGTKETNNGVVIVLSKANKHVRISTGLGTEKVLTDSIAKNIIDSIMIPQFKDGNYYQGVWEGSKAIITFLERPENKIQ